MPPGREGRFGPGSWSASIQDRTELRRRREFDPTLSVPARTHSGEFYFAADNLRDRILMHLSSRHAAGLWPARASLNRKPA